MDTDLSRSNIGHRSITFYFSKIFGGILPLLDRTVQSVGRKLERVKVIGMQYGF